MNINIDNETQGSSNYMSDDDNDISNNNISLSLSIKNNIDEDTKILKFNDNYEKEVNKIIDEAQHNEDFEFDLDKLNFDNLLGINEDIDLEISKLLNNKNNWKLDTNINFDLDDLDEKISNVTNKIEKLQYKNNELFIENKTLKGLIKKHK